MNAITEAIRNAIDTIDGPLALKVVKTLMRRGQRRSDIMARVSDTVGADRAREWDALVSEGEHWESHSMYAGH